MRLRNKVAVITGAASGIGKEAALLFAAEGAKVVVADLDREKGAELVAQIDKEGGQAIFVPVNVIEENLVQEMARRTVEAFGRVDVLYNNAGIEVLGTVVDTPADVWRRCIEVNVSGTYLCSKYILPYMIEQRSGSIINVSSVAGINGIPNMAAYCAAKGAVENLTKNMAVDFAPFGIRVNSLSPGTTLTEGMGRRLVGSDTDPEKQKARLAKYPLGRFGQPAEIARAALFLASDESSYVTGANLVVDGGMSAW